MVHNLWNINSKFAGTPLQTTYNLWVEVWMKRILKLCITVHVCYIPQNPEGNIIASCFPQKKASSEGAWSITCLWFTVWTSVSSQMSPDVYNALKTFFCKLSISDRQLDFEYLLEKYNRCQHALCGSFWTRMRLQMTEASLFWSALEWETMFLFWPWKSSVEEGNSHGSKNSVPSDPLLKQNCHNSMPRTCNSAWHKLQAISGWGRWRFWPWNLHHTLSQQES